MVEELCECFGVKTTSSSILTEKELHDPVSAVTCMFLYIMSMEPYFVHDLIHCQHNKHLNAPED